MYYCYVVVVFVTVNSASQQNTALLALSSHVCAVNANRVAADVQMYIQVLKNVNTWMGRE